MSERSVVILDNYDSFSYNLFQYVGELLGRPARVFRNDRVELDELISISPSHLIISPGPGTPEDERYFGVCRAAIRTFCQRIPVLGVCLGHQGIAYAFGGHVVRAPKVMHGKTSEIVHDEGSQLFAGVPSPATVMRYHSLMVEESSLPKEFVVTSRTHDGIIMSIEHRELPLVGVQFHPESIGTEDGMTMLRNYLYWE